MKTIPKKALVPKNTNLREEKKEEKKGNGQNQRNAVRADLQAPADYETPQFLLNRAGGFHGGGKGKKRKK